MFRAYQKNDFAYFVSLIFLVFPNLRSVWWVFPSLDPSFDGSVYHRLSPYSVFEKSL